MTHANGDFPIAPPVEPMLAQLAESLPEAGDFLFEPKWDGFRAIVFRGGGSDLYLQSRDSKPFDRYFPSCARRCSTACPSTACWTARS